VLLLLLLLLLLNVRGGVSHFKILSRLKPADDKNVLSKIAIPAKLASSKTAN
jgi:hypothetical protein